MSTSTAIAAGAPSSWKPRAAGRIAVGLLVWTLASGASALQAGEIHEAVQKADLERVAQLLANGREPLLSTDDSGRTPLHWAAFERNLELLALVFHEQALEARDFLGFTPLYLAIMEDPGTVEWLLDRGADLNTKTRLEGASPLYWAAVLPLLAGEAAPSS